MLASAGLMRIQSRTNITENSDGKRLEYSTTRLKFWSVAFLLKAPHNAYTVAGSVGTIAAPGFNRTLSGFGNVLKIFRKPVNSAAAPSPIEPANSSNSTAGSMALSSILLAYSHDRGLGKAFSVAVASNLCNNSGRNLINAITSV